MIDYKNIPYIIKSAIICFSNTLTRYIICQECFMKTLFSLNKNWFSFQFLPAGLLSRTVFFFLVFVCLLLSKAPAKASSTPLSTPPFLLSLDLSLTSASSWTPLSSSWRKEVQKNSSRLSRPGQESLTALKRSALPVSCLKAAHLAGQALSESLVP